MFDGDTGCNFESNHGGVSVSPSCVATVVQQVAPSRSGDGAK